MSKDYNLFWKTTIMRFAIRDYKEVKQTRNIIVFMQISGRILDTNPHSASRLMFQNPHYNFCEFGTGGGGN